MNLFMKLFMSLHSTIYQLTKGKIGGTMQNSPVLLLNSTGRHSHKKRTTPLVYFKDGNNYIITASAAGADKHPGWYFNIKHNTKPVIQVGADMIPVKALEANPEEKQRLWSILTEKMPQFKEYQEKTTRDIPMFILQPN